MPHNESADLALERRAIKEGWIKPPWPEPPDQFKHNMMVRLANTATDATVNTRTFLSCMNTILKAQQQNLDAQKASVPRQPLVAIQNNVSGDDERAIDRKRAMEAEIAELRVKQMRGELIELEVVTRIVETICSQLRRRLDSLANVSRDAHTIVCEAIDEAQRALADIFAEQL